MALKIITIESEEELEEFQVEIDILDICNTPFVIDLYEAYLHGEQLWLSLEIVRGGALDDIYSELERPLNENEIKSTAFQMLKVYIYIYIYIYI